MSGGEQLLKSDYDGQLLRRMFGLVAPYPGLFAGSIILYVPLNLGSLLQPYILGMMVNTVTHSDGKAAADEIGQLGLAYLGALVLQQIGGFIQQSITQLLGLRVTRDVRNT